MPEQNNSLSILMAAGDAGYVWDIGDDQMRWTGSLISIFGTSDSAVHIKGADFRRRVHEADAQIFNAFMLQSQAQRLDRDYRIKLHDGTTAWVHERGHVIFADDGTPTQVRGVLRVITARKMLEMDLTTRIRRDNLTGLPNRTHLLEMLEGIINVSKGSEKSLGYVVMAIDNMTYVNEAIGPDAADRVILGALKRVQDLIPDVIEIGENCLICGTAGIAGSTVIGNRVVLAARCGVADHLKIGDDAVLMASSQLGTNLPEKAIYMGFPAMPRERFMEQMIHLARLKNMSKRIGGLEEKVNVLESSNKKS